MVQPPVTAAISDATTTNLVVLTPSSTHAVLQMATAYQQVDADVGAEVRRRRIGGHTWHAPETDSRRRRVCREHTPSPSARFQRVYFFGGETLMSFVTLTTPSVSFASRSASALACSLGTVPFR